MTIKYLKPTQSQPEIWWACECKLNIKQYHGCFNISYSVVIIKILQTKFKSSHMELLVASFIVLIFSLL